MIESYRLYSERHHPPVVRCAASGHGVDARYTSLPSPNLRIPGAMESVQPMARMNPEAIRKA